MPAQSEYEYAVELIKGGATTKTAAEKIGITEGGLISWVSRQGLRVSELRNKPRAEIREHIGGLYHGYITTDEAVAAIKEGGGYVGAAEILEVEHNSFKHWCRKNGIKVRETIEGAPRRSNKNGNIGNNQYTCPQASRIIYEKATLKDILIRNRWDGGLSLCA